MKSLLLAWCAVLLTHVSWSQEALSYVYVEGISFLTFHVKLNGKEEKPLNKFYYLIPVEKTGETVLELTFFEEDFPKQIFVLNLNKRSCYGYKLAKKDNNHFYLQDLINKGKIVEANSMVHTGISTAENRINFQNTFSKENKKDTRIKSKETIPPKPVVSVVPKEKEVVVKKMPEPVKSVKDPRSSSSLAPPRKKDSTVVVKPVKKDSLPTPIKKETPSRKLFQTNCSYYATDKEVKTAIDQMNYKSKDEDKFLLLKKRIFSGCLSIQQTALLLTEFQGQSSRYDVLTFLRPVIYDISELESLKFLFKSSSYQEKVMALMYE